MPQYQQDAATGRLSHLSEAPQLSKLLRPHDQRYGTSGAVIILDTPDPEAVIAVDPYFATPGVTVASVREWRPFLA
ncbi:hypothetical protein Areg01_35590 [Actinoplanes regularis]|nr:hypothetical protein Areg01_35590 [Actinoplanes regularis]